MAEPWIRVHANLADKPLIGRAVEQLRISDNEAIGLVVRFWGWMSQHGRNGTVAGLSDHQIEKAAGWRGKRGRFAGFVKEFHTDHEGRVKEWDDYAGQLEARREKDRERQKLRRMSRGQSNGRHADAPPDSPRDVTLESIPARASTKRDDTKRDETA